LLDECPSLDHVAHRIVQALGVGVPAYNAGDIAGCYRVYRQTAESIVAEIGSSPACAGVAARLRSALGEAASADDTKAAWALRHAFDDLLASAAKKRFS
jgi:serine protease Do